MKRCVEFVMGVVLLLAVFVLSGPAAGVLWNGSAAVSGGTSPVVALDAGHGGADPGKIGINEVLEKDINLAVSLKTIHQNSYGDGDVCGSQMFYYKSSEKGKKLAEILQKVFNESVSSRELKAKENGEYYMLLHVSCPIVIAECGFLSNWEDAEKLRTESYQEEVAKALTKGILQYIDEEF